MPYRDTEAAAAHPQGHFPEREEEEEGWGGGAGQGGGGREAAAAAAAAALLPSLPGVGEVPPRLLLLVRSRSWTSLGVECSRPPCTLSSRALSLK